MAPRRLPHGPEILDEKRLATGHVQARLLAYVRDLTGRRREDLLELPRSMFPLNGKVDLGHLRLPIATSTRSPAGELDMRPRGREVEVRRHDRPGPDEGTGEQVLGAATLVSGDDVAVPERVPDDLLEAEVAARARVRLVAELHRRAAPATAQTCRCRSAGRRTRPRSAGGTCVAGLAHRHAALGRRAELDRLDDLDLPRRWRQGLHES